MLEQFSPRLQSSFWARLALFLPFFLWAGSAAYAQFGQDQEPTITDIQPPDVIHWQPAGGQVYTDGVIEVGVRLFTDMDFTLYIDKVKFAAPGYELIRLEAPPTQTLLDPISTKNVDVYAGGDFLLYFRGLEPFTGDSFPVEITYLGCTTRICLFPYTEAVAVPVFSVSKASPLASANRPIPATSDGTEASVMLTQGPDSPSASFEEEWADKLNKGEFSLLALIFIVFVGGLATNLTPCVAPMLPITIRLLGNQNLPPLLSSTLYASGIMLTYTALGSIAVLSGSAFGTFMQSSIVNIGFALVMALLGLSMLGFGNLSKLQSLGAQIGAGKPSAKNTFLMGAGAGLVAAPCTGPVLGALLTYTAGQQSPEQGITLMALYSLGFALPYVFLGSAAGKASKMRVPHYLQLLIKAGFGAVMFGLALYYLRVPLYGFVKVVKPYYGAVAAVGLLTGTAIGSVWLLRSKLNHNRVLMTVTAVCLGFGLFAGSQWLTQSTSTELVWYKSKEEAFKVAADTGKPILMDNWAEWCEACKKMDVTTFRHPAVIDELNDHWVLLKLDLTEGTERDDEHMEQYAINGLPTLILLPPDAPEQPGNSIIGYVSAGGLLKRLQEFKGH